jgi:hypothetical protein
MWDHKKIKRDEKIMKELQVPQAKEFMEQCGCNWKDHINGISSDRIPKIF